MDDLDINDYAAIANHVGNTPNQCMKKILEIKNNGTLRAGINSKDEDDLLIRLKTKENASWGKIASTINR